MRNTRLAGRFLFPAHNRSVAVIEAAAAAPVWERALRQFGARFFEAAPGGLTWVLLTAPAWIPIVFKLPGAIFVAWAVLLFDVYWLVRAITVVTGVYSTLLRIRRDMRKDWIALLREGAAKGGGGPPPHTHLSRLPPHNPHHHQLEHTRPARTAA